MTKVYTRIISIGSVILVAFVGYALSAAMNAVHAEAVANPHLYPAVSASSCQAGSVSPIGGTGWFVDNGPYNEAPTSNLSSSDCHWAPYNTSGPRGGESNSGCNYYNNKYSGLLPQQPVLDGVGNYTFYCVAVSTAENSTFSAKLLNWASAWDACDEGTWKEDTYTTTSDTTQLLTSDGEGPPTGKASYNTAVGPFVAAFAQTNHNCAGTHDYMLYTEHWYFNTTAQRWQGGNYCNGQYVANSCGNGI